MMKIKQLLILLMLLLPLTSIADDALSFKGIKFGMHAEQLAELGGGDTEYSCASALNDDSILTNPDSKPWAYLGFDTWVALCMEDGEKSIQVPGVSGLMQLMVLVPDYDNDGAKSVDEKTYSVEEIAATFAEVFGKFKVETTTSTDDQGKKTVKKIATATHEGAVVKIDDDIDATDREGFITITITSLDYLTKKEIWEKQKQ